MEERNALVKGARGPARGRELDGPGNDPDTDPKGHTTPRKGPQQKGPANGQDRE